MKVNVEILYGKTVEISDKYADYVAALHGWPFSTDDERKAFCEKWKGIDEALIKDVEAIVNVPFGDANNERLDDPYIIAINTGDREYPIAEF